MSVTVAATDVTSQRLPLMFLFISISFNYSCHVYEYALV